ncbi:MAG TPA: ImcF-related family protein, partial [Planctomycetota bacterium]|nr:ImcF-related family protein [Planctomycetota bacterium]
GLYRGEHIYLGRDGKSGIRKVYIDGINSLFLKPAGENLMKEMKARSAKEGKGRKDFDKLYDLVQVYKMLARKEVPDKNLMTLILMEDDRWLKALGPAATTLPPELKKIAGTQLDFYVAQAAALGSAEERERYKDISLPLIDFDAPALAQVTRDLAEGPWITEAFRDMIRLAGERYPNVSHETMIKARGKELFSCPDDKHVRGYYTQRAYNEYMQSAMDENSEVLSKKLAKLEREKSAEEILKQFRTMYKSEYTGAWQLFLENVELKNFDNLRDATNKLKVLTATDSAYRDLFKGIWEGRRLDLGKGEVINETKDDRKWVDDALKALEELQRGLDKIQSTSPPGDRFVSMADGALKDLSYLFSNAKTNIENSVKLADPALASSAARFLTRSLMSTIEALVTEAQAEAESLWKKSIYEVYLKKLAGKYPLATEAAEEIPMKAFSEVFNPKSGTFWKTNEMLQRLYRGFNFDERRLVRFSTDYEECVKKAEQFRDALYPKDSEQIQLTIPVVLGLRGGVVEVNFYVNTEKHFSSLDDPDRRGTIIWTEAAPRGTKVEIRHDDNMRTAIDKFGGMDWGLLRLFADGGVKPKSEKVYECTWTYNVVVSGTPVKRMADCTLELKDALHPFVANFFTAFKCPEKLGP